MNNKGPGWARTFGAMAIFDTTVGDGSSRPNTNLPPSILFPNGSLRYLA